MAFLVAAGAGRRFRALGFPFSAFRSFLWRCRLASERIVKIGIMSFAHMHALGYAAALKELDGVEFVGIADDDPARAKTMARKFRVKAFPTFAEMLATDMDGVIVCSENAKHRLHAVTAAQSEKHVLCEKPIATNKGDAEAIVEVAKRSGIKLMIAFGCRFHPAYKRLKQRVQRGELGKILAVKGTNHGVCPGGWFVDTDLSGGGSVIDHTVHVLDLLRDLTGAEATRVYAEISNQMYGGDFDDTGIISVDFSNKMFATIDASWSRPKTGPFWGDVDMDVTGTEGVADMEMFAQKIGVFTTKTGRSAEQYWGENTDLALVAGFVRCIAEDTAPEITGDDGVKALEVALAAYESAKSGRSVSLVD